MNDNTLITRMTLHRKYPDGKALSTLQEIASRLALAIRPPTTLEFLSTPKDEPGCWKLVLAHGLPEDPQGLPKGTFICAVSEPASDATALPTLSEFAALQDIPVHDGDLLVLHACRQARDQPQTPEATTR